MASRNTMGKELLDLAYGECRFWVESDTRGVATRFCAQPVVYGTSWCPDHLRRMAGSKSGLDRMEALIKAGGRRR